MVLPAILFTAQFSLASDATIQELENLQKQYLWDRKLCTSGRRHKLNPGLLFSALGQGGLGLTSIRVAIKDQLMRRATSWMLVDDDVRVQAELDTPAVARESSDAASDADNCAAPEHSQGEATSNDRVGRSVAGSRALDTAT